MIQRNDACWCGSGQKWKKCHFPEKGTPTFLERKKTYWNKYRIYLKNEEEIKKIKQANLFAASVVDELCSRAMAGVTTMDLEDHARKMAKEAGAACASLGYGTPPFPFAVCTSLNEVICHGQPSLRPLEEGDIVNIDFGCIVNGFFGDCSKMVTIGKVSEEKQRVVRCSYEALIASCAILKPGLPLSAIGDTIERVAKEYNCSVVDQFVGHGVGIEYHENPQVPHSKNQLRIPLTPGMVFTIEPMINAGVKEAVIDPTDGWTAYTADRRPSAQFEHSILITEDGHEILTPWTPPKELL